MKLPTLYRLGILTAILFIVIIALQTSIIIGLYSHIKTLDEIVDKYTWQVSALQMRVSELKSTVEIIETR